MFILAQILGFLAIIAWVVGILQKDKYSILMCQIVANSIYALEYFFLNVIAAGLMNLSSVFRCIIFFSYEKKNKKVPLSILLIFIIIILIIGIFTTYNNLLNFIPVIITVIYAYTLWQNNMLVTRLSFIITAIIWIYYNYSVGAYISIFGNILEIISGIISILKFNYNGNK